MEDLFYFCKNCKYNHSRWCYKYGDALKDALCRQRKREKEENKMWTNEQLKNIMQFVQYTYNAKNTFIIDLDINTIEYITKKNQHIKRNLSMIYQEMLDK